MSQPVSTRSCHAGEDVQVEKETRVASLRIDRDAASLGLLRECWGQQQTVELALTHEPYQLVYRLHRRRVSPDGAVEFDIDIACPAIIERYGVSRQARVRPPLGEVRVIDTGGRLQRPEVIDVSRSGVGLRAASSEGLTPGERFWHLWLQLPCGRLSQVRAAVARVQADADGAAVAGLAFFELDADTDAALARYVFERHALGRELGRQ